MKTILSAFIACILVLPAWGQVISQFPSKYIISTNDIFLLSTPGVATYKMSFGTLASNLNGYITVVATVTNAVSRGSNLSLTNATSFGMFNKVSGLTNMEFYNIKQGSNVLLYSDGSNVVINAPHKTNLSVYANGNELVMGNWGIVAGLSNSATTDFVFKVPDPAASSDVNFNGIITTPKAILSALPGSGSYVAVDGSGTTYRTNAGVGEVTTAQLNTSSNAVTDLQASKQSGSFLLTNFLAVGISNIVASTGISIGTNGGKLYITNTVSGSGTIVTNENQFGASTALTLKSGALLTNVNNLGTTTASNVNVAGTAAASVFNVSTGNMAYINLTNKLGPAQVALGIQQLTNVSASSPAGGDVLSYNSATKSWTSGQSVGGGSDVVSNINVTTVANVLLDLAAANMFKLSLKTNLTYTFTNQSLLTRIGKAYFQQDTVGGRSTTHGIAGGILQTNALENLQATTNANALAILDLTPGFWLTNLAVTWWGTNMQPTVSLATPASFADTFDRVAANPLDATSSSGGTWSLGPGAFAPIQGSFNAAHGTDGSDPAYNGARVLSPSFSANQSASVTLGQTGSELLLIGPCVRMESTTVAHCYAAWAESATIIRVFKLTDGLSEGSFTQSQLGSDYTVAGLVTGDVIKLTASGSSTTTLTLYVNGVAQGSPINDSAAPFTTGQPGIFLYDTVHFATAFSADDL